MRFSYYRRLTAGQKAVYRRSDQVRDLPLPDPERHRPGVDRLAAALAAEDRRAVTAAARSLCAGLCRGLGVAAPRVEVLAIRPRNAGGELHGIYTYGGEDPPVLRVWMRTAVHRRTVAFRTFLRVLLHELCHHLDVELLHLPTSFHTEGFYARESALVRRLAPAPPRRRARDAARPADAPAPAEPPQLDLFR